MAGLYNIAVGILAILGGAWFVYTDPRAFDEAIVSRTLWIMAAGGALIVWGGFQRWRDKRQRMEAVYEEMRHRTIMAFVMAGAANTSGPASRAQIERIVRLLEAFTGAAYDFEETRAMVDGFAKDGVDAVDLLAPMNEMLDDDMRETLITSAFLVAAADGTVTSDHYDLLTRFANAMDMTEPQLQAMMEKLRDGAES